MLDDIYDACMVEITIIIFNLYLWCSHICGDFHLVFYDSAQVSKRVRQPAKSFENFEKFHFLKIIDLFIFKFSLLVLT